MLRDFIKNCRLLKTFTFGYMPNRIMQNLSCMKTANKDFREVFFDICAENVAFSISV